MGVADSLDVMRSSLVFLVAVSLSACAAPPLGLGAGPHSPRPGYLDVDGRAAMAAADGRAAFQVEASGQARVARVFAIEAGVAVTRVAQRDNEDNEDVLVTGGFPYLRPRFIVRDVSLAIGLAGLGFGGGGGGVVGGIADVQLAYAAPRWGLYAGGYRQYFELVGEDPIITSARQLRVGATYRHPMGRSKLGVGFELFHQDDSIRNDPSGSATSKLFGATLKLSITTPEFK